MLHLHNGILRSRKKELLLFGTAWMEVESNMLSEISQMVKDKYHKMKLFTINRNLINKMKKQSIAKDIEIENTLIVNRDGGRGGG